MKNETETKVMEWIKAHPIHECMKLDIVKGTGVSKTTVAYTLDLLIAKKLIKVVRKFGNAPAYGLFEAASIASEPKKE